MKLFAAILVPLMIGAFTVVTTLQDSNNTRYQREADLTRMEGQGQLQEAAEKRQNLADLAKLHEQQDYNDRAAKELRIQNVYDTYMRDLTSIILKPNINLTASELLFVRSRTLSVLDQIDLRRKWYLIKFLYDSELLYVRDVGYRFVDLGGADLSNVRFGNTDKFSKRINLEKVRLSSIDLVNTSFNNVQLKSARFDFSDLNNASFNTISLYGVSFLLANLENVDFYLTQLQNTSFFNCNLKRTTWIFKRTDNQIRAIHVDYSEADLSESRFQETHFGLHVRFHSTDLDRSEFNEMKLSSSLLFKNVSLKKARFIKVMFDHVEFYQSNLSGLHFNNCHFEHLRFDQVDLQDTQFNPVPSSSKIDFRRVNLIGSNFNTSYKTYVNISDSILPNGTFITSFRSFGVNLLENDGAEEGECYSNPYGNFTGRKTPLGWQRDGDAFQVLYNASGWKVHEMNKDWQSCLFCAVLQRTNRFVVLWQEIDVAPLAMLIDMRRARYLISGYLGGIDNEPGATIMKIIFRKGETRNQTVTVGRISNNDRQGKTALIFRDHNDLIPIGTTSVIIELHFDRLRNSNPIRLGLADQLTFIIKQR
ncbi:unnamed protein product [Rotaria sp. Silwood2]|nr:unnamed protein product [Rotaria sp. Silwood2]